MVTASQLQILQSPITRLISSVSIKLDDINYLKWYFQMKLVLGRYGIMNFMDGSHPCPSQFTFSSSADSEVGSTSFNSKVEYDEFKV
ncbi:hypothetical protein ACFX1X_006465 [Malus domestica]